MINFRKKKAEEKLDEETGSGDGSAGEDHEYTNGSTSRDITDVSKATERDVVSGVDGPQKETMTTVEV